MVDYLILRKRESRAAFGQRRNPLRRGMPIFP
jgi:hypothetical protein